LPAFDRTATLILLPCSKGKALGGSADRSPGIADDLPGKLRAELLAARERVAHVAKLDDSRLLPAWRRYTGECYQTKAVEKAVALGAHVLVISGGYGIVLATEAIGWYCRTLQLGSWRGRLLERCIESYAKRQKLQVAIAFLARTSNYVKVVCRWAGAGVDSAYLVIPDSAAQRYVTKGYGEALAAYLDGTLTVGWSSEAGVRMRIKKLK
jgi:hypothetical protein